MNVVPHIPRGPAEQDMLEPGGPMGRSNNQVRTINDAAILQISSPGWPIRSNGSTLVPSQSNFPTRSRIPSRAAFSACCIRRGKSYREYSSLVK